MHNFKTPRDTKTNDEFYSELRSEVENMNSAWSESITLPRFPKLEGDIKTDVLIIGGGMAGLLCAHFLQQSGVNYILAESRNICIGVTKNTTAKITAQHGLIYDKMIKSIGLEQTQKYLDVNMAAFHTFHSLCENINCNYETKNAFVYSLNHANKIEKEVTALQKLGINAKYKDSINLPFTIAGAVEFPNQAQFNPLKFISEISNGLNIYENTHVIELKEHAAVTDHGTITAEKIIVATHFPIANNHGSYFIKQYQHRSYVIALENATNVDGMYLDEAKNGMSFRNYENLLLIGGGDHRTGKKGGSYNELENYAQKHYPNAIQRYRWATQDCMTLDGIPYIGQYSKRTPNLYVSTGFNKWGMTSSMVSAMILCDMVQGKSNVYSEVFSPSRSMLKPQLFANLFEAIAGMLIPTTKRCPHLGCGLRWNKVEHTWDCSCHGSRFDRDGTVLDNPANGDLKYK